MSPRIKPEPRPLPIIVPKRLFRFRPRVWVGLLTLVGLGLGAHFVWQRMAPKVAHEPQYLLTTESIHITPPPPWIRSDIKIQALRDSGLIGTLSVLDDGNVLSRRVKDAFEFHPWVASVERITRRLPSSLDVELRYRKDRKSVV